MLLNTVNKLVVLVIFIARVLAKPGNVTEANTEGFRGNSSSDLQTTPVTSTVADANKGTNPKPAFSARTKMIFNPQNIRSVFFTIERSNQTIVFNEIVTNSGNHYSPVTGVFVTPVAGQYFFTTSIKDLSSHGGTTLHIVLNGMPIAQVSTDWYSGNQGQTRGDSNSVVLELKRGDEVYVRSYNAGGKITGTFSGFQI